MQRFSTKELTDSGVHLVKTGFEEIPLDVALDVIAAQIYLRSKDNNIDVNELIDRIKYIIDEIEDLMERIGGTTT